jgi:ribosomal protein L7/L12/outer membrane protein assembly factor BamB
MNDSAPTSLNCPACGAPLDFDGTSAVMRCKFCGNVSLLPGRMAAPAGALDEIRRLAMKGDLVEAIKRYRQIHGVGLREAKEAVEALQAGRMASPAAPGMPPPEELTRVIEEVQRLLGKGEKIEAIKVYRENYDVSLARAKYAIEQIESGQTLRPEAGFEAMRAVAQAAPQAAPRKWIGAVVTLAVVLFIGGILAAILLQRGGPFKPIYNVNDKAMLLSAGSSPAPELAVWLFDPKAENRFIGMVNGESGKLLWKAAPLAGDGFIDALAAGPDMVYAGNKTDLLAYRRSDGSLAWQAIMTDRLNYGPNALLVTPARVITNNADQTIQAYNADNGSPVWNKRLSGYDRTLRQVGSSLMVVDYAGENNAYGLIFLDTFSGNEKNTILPTCTYHDYDSTIDPETGLVYDAGENALYLVYESSYGCVQRINPDTGEVAWSTAIQESFNFLPEGFQYLQTDSTLYFSSGNEIKAVDKASGEMKTLLSNPDYDFLPLTQSGDRLIVRARRTRGTEKFELWGVEAASGEIAWKIDLQDAKPIDPPNAMAGLVDKTDRGWTWRLTPGGLALIKFEGEPNQVILETYAVANGANLGNKTLALKYISGDFYSIPEVIGEQGGLLYLHIEQNIYSLDLAAAKLKRIY